LCGIKIAFFGFAKKYHGLTKKAGMGQEEMK
jgi:hypothetical protein